MILYHQSPFEFDKFKFDLLGKDPDKSKNGRLGVWVWNKKPEKNTFGKYLYTIEYPIIQPKEIEVERLFYWHNNYDFKKYDTTRCEYLEKGSNFLEIIESDFSSKMGVCLDIGSIKIIERSLYE